MMAVVTTVDPLSNTIRRCIKQLIGEGKSLEGEQIVECVKEIMTGVATPAQIAAFLVVLKVDKLTPHHLYLISQNMLSFATPCPVSGDVVFDVVGTGGDKWDTFNISSATAIAVGGLGVKVAKHGNRSQSGRIGSADFFEALGANITIEPQQTADIIEKCGMGFLFVQKFHPAMKYAAPVRKEIGVPTLFNVLGPLINPAQPTHMLVGVSIKELAPIYAQVLALNSRVKKAMVVHSVTGMDELGLDCDTLVWSVEGDKISHFTLSPSDFGLEKRSVESVAAGKDARENAQIFRDILRGKEYVAAYRDWLYMNCACVLVLTGKAGSYVEGVEMTRRGCEDGRIDGFVENYLKLTNKEVK